MKRISYLLVAVSLMLSACNAGFKKGKDGMEYKIISGSKGKKLENGNFVEFSFKYQVKDTIFGTSDDKGRGIFMLDSTKLPPAYYDVFSHASVGDSIVIKILADSFFRQEMPAFAKKGQIVYNRFRIVAAYTDMKQADSANAVNQQFAQAKQLEAYLKQARKDSLDAIPQLKKDIKTIEEYLASKNIKAVKAPMGTFVEILTPGDGALLDTSKIAKVKYTGHFFDGKPFDSNVDTSFHHTEAYPVEIPADVNMANVIKGWIDGLKLLSKGAKARFYVPSPLAYGKAGKDPIKPNENLVFEIEVVDVIGKQQYMAEMQAQQMAQQQMMMKMQQQQQQQQQQDPNKAH